MPAQSRRDVTGARENAVFLKLSNKEGAFASAAVVVKRTALRIPEDSGIGGPSGLGSGAGGVTGSCACNQVPKQHAADARAIFAENMMG